MNPLIREAVRISQDLEDVTFVGSVAVMLHTDDQWQSKDLDFVVAEQITTDKFLDMGYKVDSQKGKKFTPRGYRIDVYHKRDLNQIPLEYIIKTATRILVGKDGTAVKVISLEGLIVSKFRTGREQDVEDLQRLAVRRGSEIDWGEIKHLAGSDTEYTEMWHVIHQYSP